MLVKSVQSCVYDIIVLVETNLNDDISDSELGLDNFSVYRCDRSDLTSAKSSGGGVILAVKSSISSRQLHIEEKSVECVYAALTFGDRQIIIGGVYIPPQQPVGKYSRFCDSTLEAFSYFPHVHEFILMGDFNRPETNWSDSPLLPTHTSSQYISELANFFNLKQINHLANYRGVILDLVFTSISSIDVSQSIDELLPVDIHHPSLALHCLLPAFDGRTTSLPKPNFRKCHIDSVIRWLQGIDYPHPATTLDIELGFANFCSQLEETILQNTPMKRHSSSPFPNWFSNELKRLVILKKTVHRKYKQNLSPIVYEEFRRIREQCRSLTDQCYGNYIAYIESNVSSNIKIFWSHVNNLKKSSITTESMRYGDEVASDPARQCDLFSAFFASIFKDSNPPAQHYDFGSIETLSSIQIRPTEVEAKLSRLDPRKSSGPDNIPPNVLKDCAHTLAPLLCIYFNALLQTGIFPRHLKSSFIIPIYKSGSRNDVTNYRPIAIQSTLAKVFESLVLDQLASVLKNKLVSEQHGFQRGKSTVTNLVILEGVVMNALNEGAQVDCIYLDFSKAFDRVNHQLLLAKLQGYGVNGPLLMWLESYLSNRTLVVRYGGATSRPFSVPSGVPQGSHLSPFLFNIFINDIGTAISTQYLMFADDLKVFLRVSSISSCERVQDTLKSLQLWCTRNSMEINTKKSAVMSFHRCRDPLSFDYTLNNEKLTRVNKFKDLGVIFCSSLSPVEHIAFVSSRASSLLGFVCRSSRDFNSSASLIALYKTLVRPVMEYASVLWNPHLKTHIESLDRIQARFVRVAALRLGFRYGEISSRELEELFDLQPLSERRRNSDVIFLFKIINSLIECPEILESINIRVPSGTRSQDTFSRAVLPNAYSYNGCLPRMMRSANYFSTTTDIFFQSLSSFKNSLRQ